MADDNNKISEVSKEVLAPTELPRENLVATAVKFLQNPKVQDSPLYQRRAFLEKKGLTREEIEIAIERAGLTKNESRIQVHNPIPQIPATITGPYPPGYQLSRWERVSKWTKSAMVFAALAYAGYHFYKNYLKPFLLGQLTTEKRIEKLEKKITEIQSETNAIMMQIQDSVKSIQAVITQQQIANCDRTTLKQHDLNNIAEIKTEIQSLKGLLLNRRQFAPVPNLAPVLPSWQIPSSNKSQEQETVSGKDSNLSSELTASSSQSDLSSPVDDLSADAAVENSMQSVVDAQAQNEVAENKQIDNVQA